MEQLLSHPFIQYIAVVVLGGGVVWVGVEVSGLIPVVKRKKAKWIAGPLYAVLTFMAGWLPVNPAPDAVAQMLGASGVFWSNLALAAASGLLCTGLASKGHDVFLHKLTPGGPPK